MLAWPAAGALDGAPAAPGGAMYVAASAHGLAGMTLMASAARGDRDQSPAATPAALTPPPGTATLVAAMATPRVDVYTLLPAASCCLVCVTSLVSPQLQVGEGWGGGG